MNIDLSYDGDVLENFKNKIKEETINEMKGKVVTEKTKDLESKLNKIPNWIKSIFNAK